MIVAGPQLQAPDHNCSPPFAEQQPHQPLDQSVPRQASTPSSGSYAPLRTTTASSGSECSQSDLHRKLRIKAFPAGPPQQAQDQSVPPRTCTASSGSSCSPPGLNRELRIRVFPAGPQPQRISEDIPDRMPDRMSENISENMSKNVTWWGSLEESFFTEIS